MKFDVSNAHQRKAPFVSTNFMTTAIRHITMIILTALLFGKTYAQDTTTTNFFDQIKTFDLSTIWTADSIFAEDNEDNKDKIKRMEPIGFIGDDFQRFYIHFTLVKKQKDKPNEYFVKGKTKVKSTTCDFEGTIKVTTARLYKEGDLAKYKQGFAICEVTFYEDKKQPSTGIIKGKLTTHFIIDDKQKFRYDALSFVADGFANNEFEGNWTSYKTNKTKVCNWGDYRIPNSKDLDTGAGEFSVDDKYVKNGWENYKLAWSGGGADNTDAQKARQIEFEQWWK